MKKVVLTTTMILMTLTMMGCPPITTQPLEAQSTPLVEMLFDLPEDASIVSESFDFILMKTQYNTVPDMQVAGSYVIQNDGSDAILNMLYPTIAETSFYDIPFIKSALRVEINHFQEELRWNFSSNAEEQISSHEITYEYFYPYIVQDIEDPASITVHKYVFDCPKIGSGEELTLTVPEGTFILYESYMETTDGTFFISVQGTHFQYDGPETSIPEFSRDTTLTIYTVDHPADISGNYDFHGIHEIDNLANMIDDNSGSIYQAQYLVYTMMLYQDLEFNSLDFHRFLVDTRYGDDSVFSMFTLTTPLPGNGARTTIEVSFPRLPYGTHVDEDIRYLIYDFYLDSQRYDDKSISVTFSIHTDYDIESNTYGISDTSIIYDFSLGTEIHMVFSTVYEVD